MRGVMREVEEELGCRVPLELRSVVSGLLGGVEVILNRMIERKKERRFSGR